MSQFDRPFELRCGVLVKGKPCRKIVGTTEDDHEFGPCFKIWGDSGGTEGIPQEHKRIYARGHSGLKLLIDPTKAVQFGMSGLDALPDGQSWGCTGGHTTTVDRDALVAAIDEWFRRPRRSDLLTNH